MKVYPNPSFLCCNEGLSRTKIPLLQWRFIPNRVSSVAMIEWRFVPNWVFSVAMKVYPNPSFLCCNEGLSWTEFPLLQWRLIPNRVSSVAMKVYPELSFPCCNSGLSQTESLPTRTWATLLCWTSVTRRKRRVEQRRIISNIWWGPCSLGRCRPAPKSSASRTSAPSAVSRACRLLLPHGLCVDFRTHYNFCASV